MDSKKIEAGLDKLIKSDFFSGDLKIFTYRLMSQIFDVDQVATIAIEPSFVTSQIAEISSLLVATKNVAQCSYLVDLISPWTNFSVSDQNKKVKVHLLKTTKNNNYNSNNSSKQLTTNSLQSHNNHQIFL